MKMLLALALVFVSAPSFAQAFPGQGPGFGGDGFGRGPGRGWHGPGRGDGRGPGRGGDDWRGHPGYPGHPGHGEGDTIYRGGNGSHVVECTVRDYSGREFRAIGRIHRDALAQDAFQLCLRNSWEPRSCQALGCRW